MLLHEAGGVYIVVKGMGVVCFLFLVACAVVVCGAARKSVHFTSIPLNVSEER